MTDEHGSESQPIHEEVPVEEQATHEAEGGVWSDDHPPVDDFADAGTNEEAATASHEIATEDETMPPPVSGPSRSMLPLFAGIGGVLLVGAVIYWQFGHSSPPPVMPVQTSAPKSALSLSVSAAGTQSDTKPSPTVASASAPPTSQDTDIASLYKPTTESPAATPVVPPVTSTAASASPTPAASPETPTAAMPTGAMPAIAPAAPVQPASPVTPVATPVDTRIDTISARIDSLQKSLNDATRQLNQLSNMVAANQAMPPVSNQTNPALEDRLNRIEQNVMQIEHNETAKVSAATSAETEERSTPRTAKIASHHAKRATKHNPTLKKVKSKTQTLSSSPAAARLSESSPWVLRAATPGEAWVSSNPTSDELRHVQVGDSLTGIGQIRAIRQTAGGWEIEGVNGSVR